MEESAFHHPHGAWEGRDAIIKFMEAHIGTSNERDVRHYIENLSVYETEGNAITEFYILKTRVRRAPKLIVTAAGARHMVRSVSNWKLKSFRVTVDS